MRASSSGVSFSWGEPPPRAASRAAGDACGSRAVGTLGTRCFGGVERTAMLMADVCVLRGCGCGFTSHRYPPVLRERCGARRFSRLVHVRGAPASRPLEVNNKNLRLTDRQRR